MNDGSKVAAHCALDQLIALAEGQGEQEPRFWCTTVMVAALRLAEFGGLEATLGLLDHCACEVDAAFEFEDVGGASASIH